MPYTFYRIWIHVVWSTKDRLKLLNKKKIKDLYFHMKKKADNLGIYLDLLNGVEDHVHCLLSVNPKYSISWLINYSVL